MKIDEIRALLEKYQKGLCTADEQKIIDEWYDSLQLENEGLREEEVTGSLDKIRGNLQALTGHQVVPVSEVGMDPFLAPEVSATLSNAPAIAVAPVIRSHPWRRPATWIAAAVLTALLAGSAWLLFHQAPPAGPALARIDSDDTTVITGRGETKQLVLSD